MKPRDQAAGASGNVASVASDADAGAMLSRQEGLAVLILTLLAAGLRLAFFDRAAIEHFDEGVYAANFYAAHLDDRFPDRHLYAPPLLPLLIEYSIVLGGGLHAAMWVNLIAGVLTVPALWWTGRCWFGPTAGLTAATLGAFSDVHLLYSRSALTDPLLTLLLVLSVHMIWRVVCQGGLIVTIVSGLLVGAAWWTKYNGWLPLAIAAAGLVAWLLWGVLPQAFSDDEPFTRKDRRHAGALSRRELLRVLGPRLMLVCIVAIACWLPYVWSLQESGGYAAVAANHSRYVVGVAGWWNSLLAQARSLRLLEGPLTTLGMAVAVIGFWVSCRHAARAVVLHAIAGGIAACALTAWLGSASVLLLAGGWGMLQLFAARPASGPITSSESNLGAWMLSAWFLAMILVTPLYHPYSRLTLPWLAAGCLIAGMSASLLLTRFQVVAADATASTTHRSPVWIWPMIATSIGILIWQGPFTLARGTAGLRDRTAVERCAPLILEAAMRHEPTFADNDLKDVDAVFYILAEPAMFVQLSALQMQSPLNYVVQPASSLGVTTLTRDPGYDVYLVVGPHVLANEAELKSVTNITHVASMPCEPSDLVWLDEHPGVAIAEWNSDDSQWQFRLYRVRPQ
jgi:hypothetical protein